MPNPRRPGERRRRTRREEPPSRPGAHPSSAEVADIHRLLDALEQTVLDHNPEGMPPITAELWARRRHVPRVIFERLMGGRARIPDFALLLLLGLADDETPILLARIAESGTLPDLVRWNARRYVPWPETDEPRARVTFLDSLRDGVATLLEAVASAGRPPGVEILQEVLAYLLALSPERRLSLVSAAIAQNEGDLPWLLRSVLHVDDEPLQQLAIAELGRRRDVSATGALTRVAQTARSAAIRQEAAAAARRLGLHVVEVRQEQPTERKWPTIEKAQASEIDGDGGQALVLYAHWENGTRLGVNVFWKDHCGLRDAFGAQQASSGFTGLIDEGSALHGIAFVDVDAATARGILRQAVEANAATGNPIPPVFELWEPYFHEAFPPSEDEVVVDPELADAPFAGRLELLKQSGSLGDHPFFGSWFFNPDEIGPWLVEVPPQRWNRLTSGDYRFLISRLVPESTRDLLRRRLRRQAWLLERKRDEKARDLALAAAAGLVGGSETLARHPLLRRMVDESVKNGVGGMAHGR